MTKLFGTDGVREIANTILTPELAFALGRVGAGIIGKKLGRAPTIIVGKDTRLSGDMLEAAINAGITSVGGNAMNIGVIPTPGVAFLIKDLPADAGITISASHNPMEYNGIKFMSGDGFKLSDEEEQKIEEHIINAQYGVSPFYGVNDEFPRPTRNSVGKILNLADAGERYFKYAKSIIDTDLVGFKIVVDCANGAASFYTPRLLRDLGADVISINDTPDGTNINANCGSTYPEVLAKAVVEIGADLGIAHDGDADRVLAIDEAGNLVDGDHIMTICGLDLMRRGMLPQNTIVATVYSNLGLSKTFSREGGKVVITQNGDRYVLEQMRKLGVILGGEQSGHIIFLNCNTTGDGLITALALMAVLKRTGEKLSTLSSWMEVYPQTLVNVRVKNKKDFSSNAAITEVIKQAELSVGEEGRIFVRPSGTEPLIRILGEGPDESYIKAIVSHVAKVIEDQLG